MIGMVVGKKEGDQYIKAAEIALSINASTGETEARIDADHIYLNGQTSIASFFSESGGTMTFTASRLSTEEFSISGQSAAPMSFQGYSVGWKSREVVTGVNPTTTATIYYLGGNSAPS